MTSAPSPPCVRLMRDNDALVLLVEGDWLVGLTDPPELPDLRGFDQKDGEVGVRLNARRWDSALPAFLISFHRAALGHGLAFNASGLPATLRTLVDLSTTGSATSASLTKRASWLERLGRRARKKASGAAAGLGVIGHLAERLAALFAGRARSQSTDWRRVLENAGARALPIVALVNLLIGAVLAFVGAVQLQRFGAEIFVANLIGISVAREMAAVMTAFVLAGRTGAAYAAEIATMQASEEIDALSVLGIPTTDFIVLPRVVALVVIAPFLYLYATGFGLLGGLATAVAVLDLTPAAYIQQTLKAVAPVNFIIGGLKSVAFGACIGIIGCYMGLWAGRSSADVGLAATRAAVSGIVAVIALDALFALCANALGV